MFFRKVKNGSLAKYFKQKRIKDKTIGSGRKAYPFKRFKQMGHLSGSYYLSNECLRQVASHPSGLSEAKQQISADVASEMHIYTRIATNNSELVKVFANS